jgi:hypothetical protein
LTALSNSPEQELFPGSLRGSGSPEAHGEKRKSLLRLFSNFHARNYSRRLLDKEIEHEKEIGLVMTIDLSIVASFR